MVFVTYIIVKGPFSFDELPVTFIELLFDYFAQLIENTTYYRERNKLRDTLRGLTCVSRRWNNVSLRKEIPLKVELVYNPYVLVSLNYAGYLDFSSLYPSSTYQVLERTPIETIGKPTSVVADFKAYVSLMGFHEYNSKVAELRKRNNNYESILMEGREFLRFTKKKRKMPEAPNEKGLEIAAMGCASYIAPIYPGPFVRDTNIKSERKYDRMQYRRQMKIMNDRKRKNNYNGR
jgi:hypothetical protein